MSSRLRLLLLLVAALVVVGAVHAQIHLRQAGDFPCLVCQLAANIQLPGLALFSWAVLLLSLGRATPSPVAFSKTIPPSSSRGRAPPWEPLG
ncbi:MAG: hypothetical protein ACE5H3_06950 [Planctomycetota bacterium]